MRLRQALIEQSPSLALQRAAADEIVALDAMILKQRELLEQAAQPAQAGGGGSPPLPEPYFVDQVTGDSAYSADQMRAYRAAAPAATQPAQAACHHCGEASTDLCPMDRHKCRHGLQQQAGEAVAYGMPNSALTGRNRWMLLREEVPPTDQYGGAMWVPLFTRPLQPLTDRQLRTILTGSPTGHITDTVRGIAVDVQNALLGIKP